MKRVEILKNIFTEEQLEILKQKVLDDDGKLLEQLEPMMKFFYEMGVQTTLTGLRKDETREYVNGHTDLFIESTFGYVYNEYQNNFRELANYLKEND